MRYGSNPILRWLLVNVLWLVAVSCNSASNLESSGDEPWVDGDIEVGDVETENEIDTDADADEESRLTRSFYFSAAPVQFDVADDYITTVFDMTGFQDRIDIISLHMDFFGLPWDEFGEGLPLPEFWINRMTEIRSAVEELDVEVFLSLTPLNGDRTGLMDTPFLENGILQTKANPITGCFNFDSSPERVKIRTAYKAYVRWMVDFFHPVFLVHTIELNMYERSCPEDYESLLSLLNEIYDAEKGYDPGRIIFPTFVIDFMWGTEDGGACEIGSRSCLTGNLQKLDDLKRDRFGVSHYPFGMKDNWDRIPDDYYRAISDITGDRIVFGEIGYPDRPLTFPHPGLTDDCVTPLVSSDDEQKAFLLYLFEEANRLDSDLVCWWSLRDYLPDHIFANCPCESPGLWCTFYEAIFNIGLLPAWLQWGNMGLSDYQLQPKPALEIWEEWQRRPIENRTGVPNDAVPSRK